MVCENPRYIYLRNAYPIHVHTEKELHKLNKPSMKYKKGWQQIAVPCGSCACCKIEKANEWATRITNEAKMWDYKGLFITLSYNNPNLPWTKNKELTTLCRKDLVNFKKRLRKYAEKHKLPFKEWKNPYTGKIERPIRTFECGEYGFNGTRAAIGGNPHYHMIVLNWSVDDLVFDKISKKSGLPIYKSETINKIWGKGHCPIGMVSYKSAAYVARYTMKKNGLAKIQREYYDVEEFDEETGQTIIKTKYRNKKGLQESEFISMSQGIGRTWFLENKEDVKKNNCIIIAANDNVITRKVPRYYRKIWQEIDWEEYEKWRYKIKKIYEIEEQKELKKYNLPEEWLEERKVYFISQKKIENWKAKKDRLQRRDVA